MIDDFITVDSFFSEYDIREIHIEDSSTIAFFQKTISSAKKDTINFIRDTIVLKDIGNYSEATQTWSQKYKDIITELRYWENGPEPCYIIELVSDIQRDTLIIPNGPAKVQYNNTVFNDSTLYYVVTKLICDNDEEWAKDLPSSFKELNINEIIGHKLLMRE